MAQELKVCEAYICHNEFSQNELPQKKDAIVKSASYKEEDDWWDYAAKIECYRKEDVDAVLAEKDAEIRGLKRALWVTRARRASAWQIHFALSHNHSIKREFTINGASSPHDRMVTMRTARDWAMIWKNVERKCRAKAEEFK